jgi:acyl carrier protein
MNASTPVRTVSDVRDLIVRLLAEIAKLPREDLTNDTSLDEDLALESVAFLELQVSLEDELQIQIDPVEVVERNRLLPIAEYIHSLLPGPE